MTSLSYVPASTLTLELLTTALNRAFAGYYVPLHHTPESLQAMITANDIRLESSVVALTPEGDAAGLALLGIRDVRGWIGGMGLAPEWRGKGHAKPLMRAVLSRAAERGVLTVQLEVLDQNAPARHLYVRLGFGQPRPLDIFMGPLAGMPPGSGSAPEHAYRLADDEIASVFTRFREYHTMEPPWQRQQPSLERMQGVRALAVGGDIRSYLLYSRNSYGVSLLDLGSRTSTADQRQQDALVLLGAILSEAPNTSVRAINIPPGDPLGDALRATRCPVVERQQELRLTLA